MYQMLAAMLAAATVVEIAANGVGLFAIRRMATSPGEPLADRKRFFLLAVAYTLFVVYGSVLPCNYTPISLSAALDRFRDISLYRLGVGQERADWVATILFVGPVGFFWMGAFTVGDRSLLFRSLAATLACLAGEVFALAVEFLQIWFPPRTVSQNDVLAAAGGACLGVFAWLLVGELLNAAWRRLRQVQSWPAQMNWLFAAYAIGLAIYWLLPLDLVLGRAELIQKLREGRIEFVPFAAMFAGRVPWYVVPFYGLVWIPVGFLARNSVVGRRRAWWALGIALAASLAVEVARLFVFTRYSSTTSLLLGWLGIALGWALAAGWPAIARRCREAAVYRKLTTSSWPWLLLAAAYSAAILLAMVGSGEFNGHPGWTGPRFQGLLRVPFAAMYSGSKFGALSNVTQKLAVFVPLGIFAAASVRGLALKGRRRYGLSALSLAAVASVGLLVELIQVFQLTRVADVTDVLLAAAGGGLGMWLVSLLSRNSKPTLTHVRPVLGSFSAVVLVAAVSLVWVLQRHATRSRPDILSKTLTSDGLDPSAGVSSSASPDGVRSGVRFTTELANPFAAPRFTPLDIPQFDGSLAIWGSTGRDHSGHIWFGVSTSGGANPARLFELAPDSGQITNQGDIVSALRQVGVHRVGASQMKIHSRIVEGSDGHLYFASMDEQGEDEQTQKLPIWGSHLWRLRLPERRWEHLVSAPEGLIAVAGEGDWIYALGYYGHIVYQFHIPSQRVRTVKVGAAGGHISRNLICDHRGHVFVPRMKRDVQSPLGMRVTLVELDTQLAELAETELFHYTLATPVESHGLVAFQPLADRSIVFATDCGFLYRIVPHAGGPAEVLELDWFHPAGSSYVATLFTRSGERYIYGIGRRSTRKDGPYDWLVFDLQEKVSRVIPIAPSDPIHHALYVYGSVTRDDRGAFYVVGGGPVPIWSVTPELDRAILSVGGVAADVQALREAAVPRNGPAIFRVDFAP